MHSVRRAVRLSGSALLLSATLASQVDAMPVIGEPQRLQASARSDEPARDPSSTVTSPRDMQADMRKRPAEAVAQPTGGNLLRLDQQTLILVVAGFAAALSLMARLR
jgi:hypothetical protein